MMLLDTNVLIYASDTSSRHCIWASRIIADATATEGAVVNAVVLAEIMVGEEEPETVEDRIRRWGGSGFAMFLPRRREYAPARTASTDERERRKRVRFRPARRFPISSSERMLRRWGGVLRPQIQGDSKYTFLR